MRLLEPWLLVEVFLLVPGFRLLMQLSFFLYLIGPDLRC